MENKCGTCKFYKADHQVKKTDGKIYGTSGDCRFKPPKLVNNKNGRLQTMFPDMISI
jgi:hypothetical protein